MTAKELRKKYLDFFAGKGHAIIPSAPLVPENDPTTLFTGSGMQPMIPYLMGEKHPLGTRIADSQKSFRSGDIEEIGDNRHTTLFEMLGNWSLGDYFKREQIPWMFEFLTKEVGLDPKNIYVTVFRGSEALNIDRDEEAVEIWKEEFRKAGIKAEAVDFSERDGMGNGRIFYYDEKKNWWSRAGVPENMPIGEPGGPDSEMFWDFGAELGLHEKSKWENEPCHVNCDCGRFMEIGNNVFMEYLKTENGFELLKQKNVDFGGGLERILAASDNNPDIFLTDIFKSSKEEIEKLSGKKYEDNPESFRVILDHIRAATFLIGDGVLPSNKDQGYFVRRLIRRAVRFAHKLDIKNNFCSDIAEKYIELFGDEYVNLVDFKNNILSELSKEEDRFRKTLERGLKEFDKTFKMAEAVSNESLEEGVMKSPDYLFGEAIFDLVTTYGFPKELIDEEARERGIEIPNASWEQFDELFKKHQELSRTAAEGKFKGGLADHSEKTTALHTVAHLMLAGLRKVLGSHVHQKGSNITSERVRFDFSHPDKMTDDQKKAVEEYVNEAIQANAPVVMEELTLDEAKERGAEGAFEHKYGEKVKVYTIEGYSKEICGGPHVANTGDIKGTFKIKKEESSSSGVRRIKAVVE
ncbi:MAG: alanine--tRNA ligase [Candidatus Moranbacteria bacterium]|nr:alanine--tRNA ligase [Candidatus Moranbacteria bacterium]